MSRKRRHEDWEDESEEGPAPAVPCWLCERPMGELMEWHHPVPRAKGGKAKVPVHPICHKAIHQHFTNSQLARMGEAVETIRAEPAVADFLRWIANKPPDFHAPTRGKER